MVGGATLIGFTHTGIIAVLKPLPGTPPMMLAVGMRTLPNITSQVLVPRWPTVNELSVDI